MSHKWSFGAIVGAVAMLASMALATPLPTLDFNIVSGAPGVISYAGGGAPLVGTNIHVNTVTGQDTPLNNLAAYNLSNAVLNFTTGGSTGSDGADWYFASGGSISLVAGVPGIGIADGTTLFSGTMQFAKVENIAGLFDLTVATFLDTKNEALAAYYGLPGGPDITWSGGMHIDFQAPGVVPPNAFESTSVGSGDITNQVPEPGSLLLLGSGLLGLGTYIRRRSLL